MSRSELLEILIAQMEENDTLRAKLIAASDELESRKLAVHNAGSLAEAALQLNGIFEAAEAAAEQYLDNVRSASITTPLATMAVADGNARMRKQTQEECKKMKQQCEEECKNMKQQCEEECTAGKQQCEEECRQMLAACEAQCAQMKATAQAEGEKMLAHFREESRKLYERAAQAYKTAGKPAEET